MLNVVSDTSLSVNQSQVNWMIGRYVKDSHLDIFVASAFKIVNYNKVKSVVFDQVDSDTFRPLTPKVQYIVPVFVAIEMIVLYHENKLPKYTIDNPSSANIQIQTSTKYKPFDFIIFDANYFTNTDENIPIPTSFIGIVKRIYNDFDDTSNKYLLFYDIIFESEEWKMDTKSVDENSQLVKDVRRIKTFLTKASPHFNVLNHIKKLYGISKPLPPMTRSRTRNQRSSNRSKTKKTKETKDKNQKSKTSKNTKQSNQTKTRRKQVAIYDGPKDFFNLYKHKVAIK